VSGVHVTVALHPWQPGSDERRRLVGAAAGLDAQVTVEVLYFTGETHLAAVAASLAERLGGRPDRHLLLLPTGTESEAIAAMVAGRLGGVSLGRCGSLQITSDAVVARRAAFGGRVELVLRSEARLTCATLRPLAEGAGPPQPVTEEIVMQAGAPYQVEALPAAAGRPRVEGAALVVSGGRGIGGPEGFDWLGRIAGALGAGLGGSLPAVDAGWVPVAHQVGQSGKFVTPKVYFAVGISGTPQHMAGVSPGARIVALNNDRDAPIFSRCDIAVEGDWREILPLLARELEGPTGSG
jgi:electron transfer flavoprotein alpha subunit